MTTDHTTLLYEAVSVGAMNIVFLYVGKRLFPNSLVGQAIVSGMLFHYTLEYAGINDYHAKTKLPVRDANTIKTDNSRLKRCLESSSSTEECFSLASVLEYSDTGM